MARVRPPDRRRFLQALAGTGVVALAGCAQDDQPTETDDPPTNTDTSPASPADDEPSGETTTDNGHHETDHDEESGEESEHDHDHGHDEELSGPKSSATVAMESTDSGTHFSPHVVWIEPGGTVTFRLASGRHSATAYALANDKPRRIPEGGSAWDTGITETTGVAGEVTLDTPGVYDFFCVPHEGNGMLGSVIVGRPDPDGQAGLAAPQASLPEQARSKLESLNERVRSALSADESGHEHGHGPETSTETGHDH